MPYNQYNSSEKFRYIVYIIIFLDYIRDLASKALIHVYEYEAEDRKELILKLLLKQLSDYMTVGNSSKDTSGLVKSLYEHDIST